MAKKHDLSNKKISVCHAPMPLPSPTDIIPVSTITRVGCQISSIKMESFQTNRDLYNFCSISRCSQDCDALADKLEIFLKRSFSEEAKKSSKNCLRKFIRRTSEK
jgi:hypothetical protein